MINYFPTEGEGGNDPKKEAPKAPANYKTLTADERKQWNGFLDYLEKGKVGGSKDLDVRDKTLGLDLMKRYAKENPDFTISPDRIQDIQYEQYLLRKGDSFPTLNPAQLSYVRNGLKLQNGTSPYLDREVSPVDNWLGSITSRLYYPISKRVGAVNQDYGTDMESYVAPLGLK